MPEIKLKNTTTNEKNGKSQDRGQQEQTLTSQNFVDKVKLTVKHAIKF